MADNPRDLASYQNDHDLLIELRTEFRGMRTDIKDLKTSNDTIATDHEERLRIVEKNQWTFSGAASAIGTIAGYALSYFF